MTSSEEKPVLDIELTRGNAGLGFNIKGGVDVPYLQSDPGIFIAKIRETGAAADDGRLQEGDKIIEVNGENVEKVKHQEAVNLFLSSGDTVKLKVIPGAEKKIRKAEAAQSPRPASTDARHSGLLAAKIVIGLGLVATIGFMGYRFMKQRQS